MKIEVWSDYVCPYCYIGKRRLEEALNQTGLHDQVEVVFRSYQLDPNSSSHSDETIQEHLARKYQTTIESAKQMTDQTAEQAKSVGLNYDFDNIRPTNTFNAHRLHKLAEVEGVGAEASEKLLHAYFIDAENVGAEDVLLRTAKEIGISEERAKEVLTSNEYANEVRADIEEARQIGVQGVPFFVINRKYALSGAQPVETFVNALQKVASEEV